MPRSGTGHATAAALASVLADSWPLRVARANPSCPFTYETESRVSQSAPLRFVGPTPLAAGV